MLHVLRRCLGLLLYGLLAGSAAAQTSFPTYGVADKRPTTYAITNAMLVTAPGQAPVRGSLLVADGIVQAVGATVTVPSHATVIDAKGAWLYPGFIDAWSDYGVPALKPNNDDFFRVQQMKTKADGPGSWNQAVRPEFALANVFKTDGEAATKLRALGFTTVHSAPNDGVFRGTGLIAELGDGPVQNEVQMPQASMHLAFNKGTSTQAYPGSLMGSISLIRQTLLDAQWYAAAHAKYKANPSLPKPETNNAFEALNAQLGSKLPTFFQPVANQDILRAAKMFSEFNLPQPIYRGTHYEYELLNELAPLGAAIVLPLELPEAPDVEDPLDANATPLQALRRWEQAPANAYWLTQKNIRVAFSASGKAADAFYDHLRKTIAYGLTADKALEALTTTPAKLLGIDKEVGTLEKGKRANFILATGNLFAPGGKVLETWVAGRQYKASTTPQAEPRGTYNLQFAGKSYTLTVTGNAPKYDAEVKEGEKKLKGNLVESYGQYLLSYPADTGKQVTLLRLKGTLNGDELTGSGLDAAQVPASFTASRSAPPKADEAKPLEKVDLAKISPITFPNTSYGFAQLPAQGTVLIKGATLWTNTHDGNYTGDVLLEGGKIKAVGKSLTAPAGSATLDGTGKHLTTGIIDEHSHIAVERGVNECTHAVTAEVRIGDVLNSSATNIYRQLAGGVTTAQLLHGSCNPIGGQSGVVKLRWGQPSEAMKIAGAQGFIKFALGENVKRSSWPQGENRYPKTRMGVEQTIRDAFQRAKEYQAQWAAYNAAKDKTSLAVPRRDLQLDALVEILEGKRNITSHSYVQSEITMLIRLAEEMGFKIQTFTHILEGYKVADKMAAHGVSAMGFADWWSYKYETYEAIPYSTSLMIRAGVNAGINSDDAEMARRLNQEAAKTIKYGGLTELEAWKLVTLNPAKALKLDKQLGTLEPGKDADVVLWNDNPLSIYAKPLQTYVDGRLLFDADRDAVERKAIAAERARLANKLLQEKKNGTKTARFGLGGFDDDMFHDAKQHLCGDATDYMGVEVKTCDTCGN